MRLFSISLIFVAALALAGCSAVDMVYNNAPSFAASEFDDAFDLTDEQLEQLESDLQRFFDWHRQQELPRYREFLAAASQTIADGITADEFVSLASELRAAWRRAYARAIDDMGGLARTLTPEQIDRYDRYFQERMEDLLEYQEMTAQQREIFRVNRGIERLEDWFGDLGDIQRESIEAQLLRLPDFYPAWISFRESRHRALVEAAREQSGEGLTRPRLKQILLSPDSDYASAFEPRRQAYWQAYGEMIESMSADLSKAQLRHAVDRLNDYADTVQRIARND